MDKKTQESHNKLILDQFTKQAIPFVNIPGHSGEGAAKLLVEMTGINKQDTVLDVACGPGLLTSSLAPCVRQITGIDLVPAMIEQAKKLQSQKKLSNMTWKVGDVLPLPYSDNSFSIVVTRYSFHHFLDPQAVMKEMLRVVKPHGKVAVVDVFTNSKAQSDAYDELEKLRDPSHVHALFLAEFREMISKAGFAHPQERFYKIDIKLEEQYKSPSLKENDLEMIRRAVVDDIGKDRLGWGAHRKGDEIYLSYPTAVFVGEKP